MDVRGVRGERRKFDSLGVGVTGARAAPPVRLDRRGGSKVGVLWVWRPTPGPFRKSKGTLMALVKLLPQLRPLGMWMMS